MSNILVNSYDSNSFVLLKNVFNHSEMEKLIKEYDMYYQLNKRNKLDDKSISTPLTKPVESHKPIEEIISKKKKLFESIKSILGENYQFIGSETIQVKNDTHGPHRDYCFSHDVLKALICLTDRYDNNDKIKYKKSEFTLHLDGAFMVSPGSHHIQGRQSFLNQQRTEWPTKNLSRFERMTDSVTLDNVRIGGDYFQPNLDFQGRYVGFQHIPFEKGDVILFSTRAIHALYPQRKDYMMHFIGLLFIEDFIQGYVKNTNVLQRTKDILTLNIRKVFLEYCAIPMIDRIMYKKMRPHLDKSEESKTFLKKNNFLKDKKNKCNKSYYSNSWNVHKVVTDSENIRTEFIEDNVEFYFHQNIYRLNRGLEHYLKYRNKKKKYRLISFLAKSSLPNPLIVLIDFLRKYSIVNYTAQKERNKNGRNFLDLKDKLNLKNKDKTSISGIYFPENDELEDQQKELDKSLVHAKKEVKDVIYRLLKKFSPKDFTNNELPENYKFKDLIKKAIHSSKELINELQDKK